MESEKFNKQISAALRQMQPQQPADMTERFMKRLREEGLPAQPKPKPKHITRWISISAVAAAAAVLLFVFLPLEKGVNVPATQPQLTQTKATRQPKQPAEQMIPAEQMLPKEQIHLKPIARKATAPPASNQIAAPEHPQREVLITSAKPAKPDVSIQQQKARGENETAPTAAQPAPSGAITASSVPSAATASRPIPTFTAEERALMERAEEMRPLATLYAAEILQCARIEARERQHAILHQQENTHHEPKAINI